MSDVPRRQLVELDPATARVASMLTKLVGPTRAVVERFEMTDPEGRVLHATTAELHEVLENLRGHSSEEPEALLARFAKRMREAFRP